MRGNIPPKREGAQRGAERVSGASPEKERCWFFQLIDLKRESARGWYSIPKAVDVDSVCLYLLLVYYFRIVVEGSSSALSAF